ncbi:MAG TPA: nucleotidyltransferase family protein [Longimicrobiales bacterium]|nr:nucleotidyltransferase family protein [Longimicrobiales bacterium]
MTGKAGGATLARRSGPVAGVVLAAGQSRRLGSNKLLFEIDGETLVHRAVARAVEAGLDPVLVVVGHDRERVEAAISGLPCRSVYNPRFAEDGRDGSLRAGLQALPDDAAGAMVILADMPRVESWMLAALADAFRSGSAPLVASRYAEVHAPPMVFDRSLFHELHALEGRRVVRAHLPAADVLAWPEKALRDLDVPADADALGVRGLEDSQL